MRPFSRSTAAAIVSGLFILAAATASAQNVAPSAAAVPHSTVSEDSGTWRRKNPFIENGKNGAGPASARNIPLRSGAKITRQIPDGDLTVQGIMQADGKFLALINGRTVKAGDLIDGCTVKEIHRYNVVVLNERKERIIYDIYQGRIDRGKK